MKALADVAGVSFATISSYERLRAYPAEDVASRIATALGVDADYIFPQDMRNHISEVRQMRKNHRRYQYKETPLSDELVVKLESQSKLATSEAQSPIAHATHNILKERLAGVLDTLGWREREIVKLRYGIETGYSYTLEEVGKIFNITRDRVRQIEAKALQKLQHPIRSRKLESFVEGLKKHAKN